jgi:hypothetical protein
VIPVAHSVTTSSDIGCDIGTSDIVSDIDSDLNPDIGVPDIVSDIDSDIWNVISDIEVWN